jgi:SagB-type dehydrogenase family enzyme
MTGAEGLRAAPSAGATYPLAVLTAVGRVNGLKPGVYRYVSDGHELHCIAVGDVRAPLSRSAQQEWMGEAAAIICIGANFERTQGKYGPCGRDYVLLEAGASAENLMLEAVALGLGTTLVGAFNADDAARVLNLASVEKPICLVPVGRY